MPGVTVVVADDVGPIVDVVVIEEVDAVLGEDLDEVGGEWVLAAEQPTPSVPDKSMIMPTMLAAPRRRAPRSCPLSHPSSQALAI